MRLTLDGFITLTRIIEKMVAGIHCGGKTVFVLEGGYNFRVLEVSREQYAEDLAEREFPGRPTGVRRPMISARATSMKVIDAVKIKHDIL
jgi:acetoin utilization deacetylase AcuC-like enzyme